MGEGFEGFTIMVSGNETKNYLLSIDFAKKLAMQVKTEVGEQMRNCF
jgi:phage anti-repressor protein